MLFRSATLVPTPDDRARPPLPAGPRSRAPTRPRSRGSSRVGERPGFPSAGSGATIPFRLRVPKWSGRPGRGSERRWRRRRRQRGAVMAELVQGQSAPVGMKAEGFVDALHRVRQVRARPAGGSAGARGGAGSGLMGRRRGSSLGAGRKPGLTPQLGASAVSWGACSREEPWDEAPVGGPRPRLSGGSPRFLQLLGKG